ncbi:hypothetical protein H8F21_14475 [Pseudomonas sp. P66]|uniref:Uncharacterized protein n=1 Tax=Pseudomonas arcuscaelestis TaxID=2710591 RepID=A0ABS2BZ61_9PSED|nr:hypothetical protein [Pseudomonas arcuscaelestis]MBM5458770.1 hypothetical protein [Pseudomonas arcuscaelestis]
MNIAYQQAITLARSAEQSIRNRMRGWAVIEVASATTLISLAYIDEGVVDARVIWQGLDTQGAMQLVADHMNENAGAGRELVSALVNAYHLGAPKSGLLVSMALPVSGAFH